MGNALAVLSAGLAEAQEKVRNERTFAQPATSLVWLFERIARLNGWVNTFLVITDVCMFGAPWRKPTSILAIPEEFDHAFRQYFSRRADFEMSLRSLRGAELV